MLQFGHAFFLSLSRSRARALSLAIVIVSANTSLSLAFSLPPSLSHSQLRYPNSHTQYMSCVVLHLFAAASDMEIVREQVCLQDACVCGWVEGEGYAMPRFSLGSDTAMALVRACPLFICTCL